MRPTLTRESKEALRLIPVMPVIYSLLVTLVLLAAPLQGWAQTPAAAPVRITVALPQSVDVAIHERLKRTWLAAAALMGRDVRHAASGRAGEPGAKESWTAPKWAELPAEERGTLIAGLCKEWGDNLTIEPAPPLPEAQTDPRPQTREQRRQGFAAAGEANAALSARLGDLPDGGAAFDNSFPATEPYQETIDEAAKKHDVDPALIEAVILSESNGRPRLRSPAGARGLMQLTPGTARAMGVKDPYNPAQNIDGGTKYLKELITRFHGNTALAVAAYNAGPNRDSLDDGRIPAIRETVYYVARVFYRYSQLTGTAMVELESLLNEKALRWYERETERLERLWGPASRQVAQNQ